MKRAMIREFLLAALMGALLFASDSSAAAKSDGMGRLIVYRSAAFGSRTFLELWVDGNKAANIGPGSRYDEPISAGHHILTVNYTPKQRHAAASTSITVQPGETYKFTVVRNAHEGAVLMRSSSSR